MEEFFYSLGVFAFFVIIGYLFLAYLSNKSDNEAERRDLAKYYNLNNEVLDPNKSYDQNLKKVFSDPKVRQEAEENRKEYNEREAARKDKEHRENIIKRTYSYKYEDVIYEIFSPYRKERRYIKDGQKWEVHEELENEFVIHEISRLLNVNIEEARMMFKEFDDNDLLFIGLGRGFSPARKCSLGVLLRIHWNIISQNDKNFSKWVEGHPNIESVESANKRRAPYDITVRIPFRDFVQKNGKFETGYDGIFAYLYFNYGIKVKIDKSLGIDVKSNQYSLKSIIEEIKDLYVIEDDGFYKLIKV